MAAVSQTPGSHCARLERLLGRFEYFTVNCVILFRYSVTVFELLLQLQLLAIIQLQLTEAYFSVISHFSYRYYELESHCLRLLNT